MVRVQLLTLFWLINVCQLRLFQFYLHIMFREFRRLFVFIPFWVLWIASVKPAAEGGDSEY
jgi:hypothetical protein